MIRTFTRWGQPIGRLRSFLLLNFEGRVDVNSWFCPRCGSLFAATHVLFEPNETPCELEHHIIRQFCGEPLFNLREPHPTFWACADLNLLNFAFKEHFNHDSGCLQPNPQQPDFFAGHHASSADHPSPILA